MRRVRRRSRCCEKKFAADVVDIPLHDRNGVLVGVIGITRRGGYMAAKKAESDHR